MSDQARTIPSLFAPSGSAGSTIASTHGTNDTRKICRQSSNGCIGLYNEHIVELFDLGEVGMQVKII